MAEQIINNFSTYITATIASSSIVIPVASTTGLPSSGEFHAQILSELLFIVSVSGSVLIAQRGRESTTAVSATSGTTISFPITRESIMSVLNQEMGGGPIESLGAPRESVLYYPSNASNIIYASGIWIPLGFSGPVIELDISGWAWTNQDGATITQLQGVTDLFKGAAAGERYSIYDHAAPPTPYTVTCMFSCKSYVINFPSMAPIVIRDGTTGRFDAWSVTYINGQPTGGNFEIRRMTNPTSFNSVPFGQAMPQFAHCWYRFRDDGTNHYFSFSMDGFNFKQVWQNSRTAWTANPNRIGFAVNPLNATHAVQLDIYSWQETLG